MSFDQKYGVQHVANELNDTLRTYLEAQYHIRNESLIKERHFLLKEPGTIWQKPFIEATPTYIKDKEYKKLNIPEDAKNLLTSLVDLSPPVGAHGSSLLSWKTIF
jgi:hypothetical protein